MGVGGWIWHGGIEPNQRKTEFRVEGLGFSLVYHKVIEPNEREAENYDDDKAENDVGFHGASDFFFLHLLLSTEG